MGLRVYGTMLGTPRSECRALRTDVDPLISTPPQFRGLHIRIPITFSIDGGH